IYRTGQKAEALWRYLTRRHKRRRPRRARASRDTIKDRASIHDRPKTIENRGEAGHWEGDLIICKCTRPVLVLHERKSRVTLAARLTGKTAAETISAMLAVFGRIDPHLRRSITFDNDTSFAQHGLLRTMRDMTTWFCDAFMPHGKKAASKTPMDAYVDGCRATSISTGHPTRKSRRSSSRPTSRPANASGSRRHSKPCLPSLERTFKSASLNRVALRSGIQGPHDPERPLVCLDETSKQLVAETRTPIPMKPGSPARHDYEYERHGVANLFMMFAPLEGWRQVKVTDRHTAIDYAHVLRDISDTHFADAKIITLLQDNLNIHAKSSLYEAFPATEARRLVNRFEWVYTPKHGSWLDLAESELAVHTSQCLD